MDSGPQRVPKEMLMVMSYYLQSCAYVTVHAWSCLVKVDGTIKGIARLVKVYRMGWLA